MKQIVKFAAALAVFAALVFSVPQFAEAASAASKPQIPQKPVVTSYSLASSWASMSDPNLEFSYLSVRVETVQKNAPGSPAGVFLRMDLQLHGGCAEKSCDYIYLAAVIPEGSYTVDKTAHTASFVLNLADSGVQFLYGNWCFQNGTCTQLNDFPAVLGNSADLQWKITEVNPGSGNATLAFTDFCKGKGRTDAFQLDGVTEVTGHAFGYRVAPYGYGHLVFRDEKTTMQGGACWPTVAMPYIVFNYGGGGMGMSNPTLPPAPPEN